MIKIIILAILFLPSIAFAQDAGGVNYGVSVSGAVTPNDCVKFNSAWVISDSGSTCGGGGGSGTVTSVSVTTANGVSGTVATATTTPAITITLGAITPSSVVSSGSITATSFIPNGASAPVNGLYLPATNTSGISANSIEVATFNTVASGVDYLTFTAGLSGTTPIISVDGTTANQGLAVKAKGTGTVTISGGANGGNNIVNFNIGATTMASIIESGGNAGLLLDGAAQYEFFSAGGSQGFGIFDNSNFHSILTINSGATGDVFLGYLAGASVSGAPNVIIGPQVASTVLTTGINNILIGTSSATTTPAAGSSNEVNIGGLLFWNKNSLAAPVVSACGTSPSIDAHANNRSGTVTVGTVTASSCTITFAGSGYTTWNHCRVTEETAGIAALAYSYSLTAITVTGTSLVGGVIDYDCDGF